MSTPERSWSIRAADLSDAGAIARLCGALGYPSTEDEVAVRIRPVVRSPRHGLFLADDPDHGVVGWIHVFATERVESDRFAEIGGLVVGASVRDTGVGSALVDRARRWATDAGLDRLRVRTREERHATHLFYARTGFVHVKSQRVFDADLVVASGRDPGVEVHMQDRTVIATVRYRHEAELIRGLLESCGIEAAIEGDDCGGENPALAVVRGIRVRVGPGDVAAAEELLASSELGVERDPIDPMNGDGRH